MPKYKITNVSANSPKGKRNVFLVEVGKTVGPGEAAYANSIQPGTKAMAKAKIVKIDEGDFPDLPVLTAAEEERLASSNPVRKPSKVFEVGDGPAVPPPGPVPLPEAGGEQATEGEPSKEPASEPFSDKSMETDDGGGSKRDGGGGGGGRGGKGKGGRG